jgi:hypothetical protein
MEFWSPGEVDDDVGPNNTPDQMETSSHLAETWSTCPACVEPQITEEIDRSADEGIWPYQCDPQRTDPLGHDLQMVAMPGEHPSGAAEGREQG